MKSQTRRTLNRIAAEAGASGWTLVREAKHMLVDFHYPAGAVRQAMALTPSDRRAERNMIAELRRSALEGDPRFLKR